MRDNVTHLFTSTDPATADHIVQIKLSPHGQIPKDVLKRAEAVAEPSGLAISVNRVLRAALGLPLD